jgi:hypothetical protein
MTIKRCACGRLVNAGRTGTSHGHTRCLICETRDLFKGWRYRPTHLKPPHGAA